MSTSIDTNAEPVLSLLYLLILFSSLLSISGVPFPASPPSPIEARIVPPRSDYELPGVMTGE
jgi:hypothetical protein